MLLSSGASGIAVNFTPTVVEVLASPEEAEKAMEKVKQARAQRKGNDAEKAKESAAEIEGQRKKIEKLEPIVAELERKRNVQGTEEYDFRGEFLATT